MATDTHTAAVARIYNASGKIIGTGVLVSDTQVLTCAHVVNDALGRGRDTLDPPPADATVTVEFPVAASGKRLQAKIVAWQYTPEIADLAGLELLGPLPAPIEPARLKLPHPGEAVTAFGFPKGYNRGLEVPATLPTRVGGNWLQMNTTDTQRRFITGGFSGGPVWSSDGSGIVGITAESDSEEIAYCIPAEVLAEQWDVLNQLTPPFKEKKRSIWNTVLMIPLIFLTVLAVKTFLTHFNPNQTFPVCDRNKICIVIADFSTSHQENEQTLRSDLIRKELNNLIQERELANRVEIYDISAIDSEEEASNVKQKTNANILIWGKLTSTISENDRMVVSPSILLDISDETTIDPPPFQNYFVFDGTSAFVSQLSDIIEIFINLSLAGIYLESDPPEYNLATLCANIG